MPLRRRYLDEFQTHASDYLADAMVEARKYKISLVLANQTLSQIDGRRDRADAMGGILSRQRRQPHRLSHIIMDAEIIARRFAPRFSAEQLTQLPDHTAAVRLLSGGTPLQPMTFKTLPQS